MFIFIKLFKCKGGDKVGYIIFENDKAFEHLVKKGFVYTLRAFNRSTGVVKLKRNKAGKFIGFVKVELVGNVKRTGGKYIVKTKDGDVDLNEFVPYSGFSSLDEWLSEFFKYYKTVGTVKLYKVTLVKLFYKFLF